MDFKLALRNVKKSFRDYAVYFLTLMFAVCIFYVFNSLESQQSIMALTASQHDALRVLSRILDVVSVFVSVILGFLIVYANRFLIRRRKKELGIYQILGMGKGRISQILIIETVTVALLSLACGLVLGVFVSQGFAVLTAALFEVTIVGFHFIFSPAATIKAITYFGISFVFVMLFNHVEVGRQKLINLLYADRKNEKFKTPYLFLSVIIFIISSLCLAAAYTLIIRNGLLYLTWEFFTSIALGFIGTFLFFLSLSGFFLKIVQQNKLVYFKGLNMFVLRQLNNKINTSYISLTMVCLMLFIAICALSTGMGVSKSLTNELERLNPYDATYWVALREAIYDDERGELLNHSISDLSLLDEFYKAEIPVESYAREIIEFQLYLSDMPVEFSGGRYYNKSYIKLDDYNRLMQMQGMDPVTMGEDEFIFICIDPSVRNEYVDYISKNKFFMSGRELTLKNTEETVLYNMTSRSVQGLVFVLPNEIPIEQTVWANIVAVHYLEPTKAYNDIFIEAREQVRANIREHWTDKTGVGSSISPSQKINNFEENRSVSSIVAYLSVYLGIVFLIVSAVVLAITQLSESSDNMTRYELLRKLGTDRDMINKALFMQIAVYFVVPLMLATVHSAVGIKAASDVILMIGDRDVLSDSIFTAAVIMIIYGGYFLATYFGSKRIINKE